MKARLRGGDGLAWLRANKCECLNLSGLIESIYSYAYSLMVKEAEEQ